MKDNTIVSVELTTMGNLVAKTSRNKHQNPIKMQLTLPFFISDDKNLQKNLKNLKGQEINREIKEIKEFNYGKKISYSDEFVQLLPGEKDYDKKYSVESGKLINALYRALKPKLEKKYSKTQINKRVLVVLNESRDNFKIPHNILHWFLVSALYASLDNINNTDFFDNIQVYFEIHNEKKYSAINNLMKNYYPLPNPIYDFLKYRENLKHNKKALMVNLDNNKIEKEHIKNNNEYTEYTFKTNEKIEGLHSISFKFNKEKLKNGTTLRVEKNSEGEIRFKIRYPNKDALKNQKKQSKYDIKNFKIKERN